MFTLWLCIEYRGMVLKQYILTSSLQRIQNSTSAVRLFGSLPCSYHMQNPGSGFFSIISCLSSSNAHVLAAQDITDLFIVEQRSVLFKKNEQECIIRFQKSRRSREFL